MGKRRTHGEECDAAVFTLIVALRLADREMRGRLQGPVASPQGPHPDASRNAKSFVTWETHTCPCATVAR
jgi:hypothetical protein